MRNKLQCYLAAFDLAMLHEMWNDEEYKQAKDKMDEAVESAESEFEELTKRKSAEIAASFANRFRNWVKSGNVTKVDLEVFENEHNDDSISNEVVDKYLSLIADEKKDEAREFTLTPPKVRKRPRRAFTDDDRRVVDGWIWMKVPDGEDSTWMRTVRDPSKSFKKLVDGSKQMPSTLGGGQWLEFKNYLNEKIQDKEAGLAPQWWDALGNFIERNASNEKGGES
jgi:hypothetical protein